MVLSAVDYTPREALVERAPFELRGASVDLMCAHDREVLYEGPANTGKTRTVLEKVFALAEEVPNLRILLVRATRKSMSNSVLVTWEQHVVPEGHPCLKGPTRDHRDHYFFPNGTDVDIGGMDNPDRIMSTEYDLIAYFEATEGSLDQWEKLLTRLRNKKILVGHRENGEAVFFAQAIADCNPSHKHHWLNVRAGEGKMQRIRARHADNPIFNADDQATLDALSGARRKRLRDGLWVSEEGQVWEEYDPDVHDCYLRDWLINPEAPDEGLRFHWYFAGLDFGQTHAQALEVFGVIGERMVRVAEVYKREHSPEWWASAIEKVIDRFPLEAIVADSADKAQIRYLNDRLGPMCGREEDPLVIPFEKVRGYKAAAIEIARDLFDQCAIMFAQDALLEGPCEVSRRKYKPIGLTEELVDYRWAEIKDGQRAKDEPDPRCVDHGVDAFLMAVHWRWGRDYTPEYLQKKGRFDKGTYGDVLDHDEVLNAETQFIPYGAPDELWPGADERDEWGNLR